MAGMHRLIYGLSFEHDFFSRWADLHLQRLPPLAFGQTLHLFIVFTVCVIHPAPFNLFSSADRNMISSHQDLRCLQFCFDILTETLFGTKVVLTIFKDGKVHFRKSGMIRLSKSTGSQMDLF